MLRPLSSILVDSFKQARKVNPQSAPFSYFYCARNAAEQQRAEPDEVMRSIVKQLSCSSPDRTVWQPIIDTYNERKEQAEEEGGEPARLSTQDCVDLILAFAEQNPITIIIDALDECDPAKRHELLTALGTLIRDSSDLVKIFVSSRDDNDIVCRLSDSSNIYIHARDNGEDIERFVKTKVAQSIRLKRLLDGEVPDYLKDQIVNALIQGAQGMYVYVSSMAIRHADVA